MFQPDSASPFRPNRRRYLSSFFPLFLAGVVLVITLFPSPATKDISVISSPVEASASGSPFRVLKTQTFAWPTSGPITSLMDYTHPLGIDIGLGHDPYAPIVATASGTVTFAGGSACCSYGYYITIDHHSGLTSLYAHLSSLAVQEGDKVSKGQVIGAGGDTGRSSSAHLHFEVRDGEDHVDPLTYLPKDDREITLDSW